MDDTPSYIGSTDKKPSKKKTIWLVIIILTLIASNVAWALFYIKQQGELNTTVTTLNARNAKLAKDNKSLQSENSKLSSETGADYREIPELGVKYKLDSTTQNVTYSYSSFTDAPSLKSIDITTIELVDAQKNPKSTTPESSQIPLSTITQYKENDTAALNDLSSDAKDFASYAKANPKTVKKIGAYYFVYSPIDKSGQYSESLKQYVPKANTSIDKAFSSLVSI